MSAFVAEPELQKSEEWLIHCVQKADGRSQEEGAGMPEQVTALTQSALAVKTSLRLQRLTVIFQGREVVEGRDWQDEQDEASLYELLGLERPEKKFGFDEGPEWHAECWRKVNFALISDLCQRHSSMRARSFSQIRFAVTNYLYK